MSESVMTENFQEGELDGPSGVCLPSTKSHAISLLLTLLHYKASCDAWRWDDRPG